ncbi:MAG: PhoPQ-activated pathogenicity-like protein PqaA type [Saprospiraceae bacterium]|nr:PhoPQ-activated pathogenicity-like protein PqaA type [Saprospiraceae bacterium]
MKSSFPQQCANLLVALLLLLNSCGPAEPSASQAPESAAPTTSQTPLEAYMSVPDDAFTYELKDSIKGQGYTAFIIRMVSQRWLTTAEVKDPTWWHWLTIVVPDEVITNKGMLFIGGGSRRSESPDKADEMQIQAAVLSKSITANLHNVPNQPMEFVGDDYGPRVEDELIAYGWRKFLEGGAKDEDAIWLARLPMTKAAVRAMDVISEFSHSIGHKVDQFMVAGGSKRGWTTWTTAAVDDRVVAIAPIVIDLLNVVPSFEHHWRVYGFWAPAVGNYVAEGIMDWQGSKEYDRLISITEPYSYLDKLDMPKLLLNATGDQFFIPDSWKFYWDDLKGEKNVRYVPNTDHSMRESDVIETLISFYQSVVLESPRPEFAWRVENGTIHIETADGQKPASIKLWKANNPDSRDFRLETIGKAWESEDVPITAEGIYQLKIDEPKEGYSAFFAELSYPGAAGIPLKLTTGVVVTPDTYPHESFAAKEPQGTPKTD